MCFCVYVICFPLYLLWELLFSCFLSSRVLSATVFLVWSTRTFFRDVGRLLGHPSISCCSALPCMSYLLRSITLTVCTPTVNHTSLLPPSEGLKSIFSTSWPYIPVLERQSLIQILLPWLTLQTMFQHLLLQQFL